ncbi:MAG: hypothetical protein PHQ86_03275 [Dehalococcoidales bacterium]|nr:hypothetical protein [Dehalococcoidales bacterium]
MKKLVQSALENPKITIVEGGGCPCMAGMIQAVVELSADITNAMPRISQLIEGCVYNPEINIMGFRAKGMGVVVEANKITINMAKDVATAKDVIDWIKSVNNGNEML